jgi:hypothetical protein
MAEMRRHVKVYSQSGCEGATMAVWYRALFLNFNEIWLKWDAKRGPKGPESDFFMPSVESLCQARPMGLRLRCVWLCGPVRQLLSMRVCGGLRAERAWQAAALG